MPSFFGATGAFGTAIYGTDPVANVGDCPVPAGVMGIFFTEAEHDGWCNCVYRNEPVLNSLCKIKIGQKLPDGTSFADPSMPWTVTGKRTRGLLDDALGRLLRGAMAKAMGFVEGLAVAPDPQTTQPAGPSGPGATSTTPTNTYAVIDLLNTVGQGGLSVRATASGLAPPTSLSTLAGLSPTTLAIGALAVWYFLLREPKSSVAGFGGFGRHRRRRSRRIRTR